VSVIPFRPQNLKRVSDLPHPTAGQTPSLGVFPFEPSGEQGGAAAARRDHQGNLAAGGDNLGGNKAQERNDRVGGETQRRGTDFFSEQSLEVWFWLADGFVESGLRIRPLESTANETRAGGQKAVVTRTGAEGGANL